MTIAEKLQKLRRNAGLSQAQLAEVLHVSRAAVAKWENGNGMPDVANLKALSDYFHIDMGILLDDKKDLSERTSKNSEAISYCGKNCETCTDREQDDCPGCKLGPARGATYCEIARCCQQNSQTACAACTRIAQCGIRIKQDDMPRLRVCAERVDQAKKEVLRTQAPFFARWIGLLFWLFIPVELAGFISDGAIGEYVPVLRMIGCMLSMVISVTEGLILRYISRYEPMFKNAGDCVLVRACADLAILLLPVSVEAQTWKSVLLITKIILGMTCSYHEMNGYARILADVDLDLSEKWEKLWKCYLVTFGLLLAGILIIRILKSLARIALLLGLVCSIFVSILALIYKYKTVKTFKTFVI